MFRKRVVYRRSLLCLFLDSALGDDVVSRLSCGESFKDLRDSGKISVSTTTAIFAYHQSLNTACSSWRTCASVMSLTSCVARQSVRRLASQTLRPTPRTTTQTSYTSSSCANSRRQYSLYRPSTSQPCISSDLHIRIPNWRPFSTTSHLSHGHLTPPKAGEEQVLYLPSSPHAH